MIFDNIVQQLDYLITTAKHKRITLVTNPYLAAYTIQGFPSHRMKWFWEYKQWIQVKDDVKMGMMEYAFLDGSNEIINLDMP